MNAKHLVWLVFVFLATVSCAADDKTSAAELRIVRGLSLGQVCPPAETTTLLPAVFVARVKGRVLYNENHSPAVAGDPPLPGVRIVVFALSDSEPDEFWIAVSDAEGKFTFEPELPPGIYRLLTCFDGWDAMQLDLEIVEDGPEEELVFQLEPS